MAWSRRRPEPGVAPEAWAETQNRRADKLAAVRGQVRKTGIDVGQFMGALALANEPSGADFVAAIAGDEAALASCECELAELERERGRRGKHLGGRRLLRCQR